MSFDTSLLREKFLIKEDGVDKEHHRVVSNRLVLKFKDDKDKAHKFIVRAQTMHNCIRLAARIMQAFQRGTIAELTVDKAKWKDIWEKSLSNYDQKFNPHLWALVYHDGDNIFSSGAPHAFLDMIERCDASSRDEYDASIKIAERAFAKAGNKIDIAHEGNVGLVINVKEDHGRCGVILRNALQNATFNMTLHSKSNADDGEYLSVTPSLCLNTSAAYLEGIQLAFMLGMAKAGKGNLDKKAQDEGLKRLGEVTREIDQFENTYDVKYRPDKPAFPKIMADSETFFESI